MNGVEAEQLHAFLAVLETGSFTAAGRQLGRDGSVVSRRVAAMEARLGIRLLERSTRRVSATQIGARYRDHMRAALELMRDAENQARAMASEPSGLLRLAVPSAFGRQWLAPALPVLWRVFRSFKFRSVMATGLSMSSRKGMTPPSGLEN